MAHEIETAMFVKEKAWHGLGTILQDPPTVQDGLIAAGLGWKVEQRSVFIQNDDASFNVIDGKKAIVRDSDNKVLGVMSDNYRPLQNFEAFDFFNPILDSKQASLEAAGALKGGKVIWVLAKLNGVEGKVIGSDNIKAYLLLHNSHDGSKQVGVQFTNIRVVCNNTLTAAIASADQGVKVRHTKNLTANLDSISKAIDTASSSFDFTLEQYKRLTQRGCTIDGLKKYVCNVFGKPFEGIDLLELALPRQYDVIENSFLNGPGADLTGAKGTAWGAYNAITDFIDHHRGRSDDQRLYQSWFGNTAPVRDKAFELAFTI